MSGVNSPNLVSAALLDSVLGNRNGTTVKTSINDLAAQLAASPAMAGLVDDLQPASPRLDALAAAPPPSARAAIIGTAAGGYTNRPRARRVIFDYGQSNISNSDAKNWTPPPNLFVWNGGLNGAIGSAFEPCPGDVMRIPYAHAARLAEQNPDTDYYLVACATGGTGIRAVVGMDYLWSSASGDPGAGAVALDAGAAGIRYAKTDAAGLTRFIGVTTLDDTFTTGGVGRIEVISDPSQFVTLNISGTYVDHGGYRSQPCTLAASASWPPADGTPVRLYPARHWLREVIRANIEGAMTALGLTGVDRRLDQVIWWHTESDMPYEVTYGARDYDALMTYFAQWTDAATTWINVLPWPHHASALDQVRAWWEVIKRKCGANSTQRKVISLEATPATDWGDSNNVHVIGADARIKIGRLIADAAAAGGGGLTYASGPWTPIVSLGANAIAAAPGVCLFQQVGDVVTVSGRIIVTASALNTDTTVTITLPVTSEFRDANDGLGVVSSDRQEVGVLFSVYSGGADQLSLSWRCLVAGSHSINFTGIYMVR